MSDQCKCQACSDGIEAVIAREQEIMKKHGWVVHCVVDDKTFGSNCHTHGLMENMGHMDLQICLPLDPTISHSILSNIVRKIKEGVKYKTCDEVGGFIKKL